MTPDEQNLDMLVAELDRENRLLRARNERLEREAEQQNPVPVTDNTYGYAKSLAEAIFKQHYASDEHYASGRIVWGVNDTVIGILTQIDNMVADMVRKPLVELTRNERMSYEELEIDRDRMKTARDALLLKNADLNANQRKPWVGLTDEEDMELWRRVSHLPYNIVRHAIESKLREKNQ